jgi:hypothetical protein
VWCCVALYHIDDSSGESVECELHLKDNGCVGGCLYGAWSVCVAVVGTVWCCVVLYHIDDGLVESVKRELNLEKSRNACRATW